jgi:hypothetical protein
MVLTVKFETYKLMLNGGVPSGFVPARRATFLAAPGVAQKPSDQPVTP